MIRMNLQTITFGNVFNHNTHHAGRDLVAKHLGHIVRAIVFAWVILSLDTTL